MSPSPREELDAILVQAPRLQAEQQKTYSPPSLRSDGPYSLDRFSTYRALYPWRLHMGWWLLLLLWPATNTFLHKLRGIPADVELVISLSILTVSLMALIRISWYGLAWFSRFMIYRTWRKRLHLLRIEGWTKLVATPQFANYRYWRHCTIHLHLLSSASLTDHALQTLLFMFCTEANHCGYPADTETDQRQGWVLKGNVLTGSVNCHVARQIHELCRHLSVLNRVEPTVESLLIVTNEDGWETEPFHPRAVI